MSNSDRIVSQLPLKNLWKDDLNVFATRKQNLKKSQLNDLLKSQPVEFVIADIGKKLKWIGIEKCYSFWKSEAETNIVEDMDKIILENYPNEYAYIASEWINGTQKIILLETFH